METTTIPPFLKNPVKRWCVVYLKNGKLFVSKQPKYSGHTVPLDYLLYTIVVWCPKCNTIHYYHLPYPRIWKKICKKAKNCDEIKMLLKFCETFPELFRKWWRKPNLNLKRLKRYRKYVKLRVMNISPQKNIEILEYFFPNDPVVGMLKCQLMAEALLRNRFWR